MTSTSTKPEVVWGRRGRHLAIIVYDVITPPRVARFGRNLVIWCRIVRRLLWCGRTHNRKNSNMADVVFQIGSSYISAVNWDMSTEFGLSIEFEFRKNVTTAPPRHCILRHYSAACAPIWTKYRHLMQDSMQISVIWSKSQRENNSNMAEVCFSKPEVVSQRNLVCR